MKARGHRLLMLLIAQIALASGCTTALWDKSTFAHYYRPANPSNLHLFYSRDRKDVLVQYDEWQDTDEQVRTRCYWLEPSTSKVNREQKPHFVSAKLTHVLVPIPLNETLSDPPPPGLDGLHAVAGRDNGLFRLYSGRVELECYRLPTYLGSSQKVKQVLLTPFALIVDATIVGAVIAYYSAPSILPGLNR